MPKRYSKEAQTGEAGIALIDRVVTAMGFVWHPRRIDHGVDGEIELVDGATRRPLNRFVLVQSKARKRFPGEDEDQFHYLCEPDDVAYWLEANAPVILVCSHPETGEAWWAPVTERLTSPDFRATRRIDFDKRRCRFDAAAAPSVFDLALPPTEGLYVPAMAAPERLMSNLLSVDRMPPTIWAAPAIVKDNRQAGEMLRSNGVYSSDWTVHDGTVFSFRRPDEEFAPIIDGGVESIDTAEWAEAKSTDTVHLLVRLLNQTLVDTHHRELRRHPKRHYLYFRSTTDLTPRGLSTGKSNRGRVVFRGYPDAGDPESARHFRHHAVEAHFVRLDGKWFIELSPTYHFTLDGVRDLPWGAELVKGMKRREKNAAVGSLVDMWATYFARRDDLFTARDDAPILFGALETFTVQRGIDERAWKVQRHTQDSAPPDLPQLFEAS